MKVRQKVVIPITDEKISATFYSFEGFNENDEHLLIEIQPKLGSMPDAPYVRIHSECLTGDVFSSSRCDCGNQLQEAIAITAESGGYIAYLRQEGRGIGLYNKLDAYRLQDGGLDTYKANRELGFEADSREFNMVADMLLALDINRVKLLTNNPKKALALSENGIEVVSRRSTSRFESEHNLHYLNAKMSQEDHQFGSIVRV